MSYGYYSDSDDMDEEALEKRLQDCGPLSNLPTPPLPSRHTHHTHAPAQTPAPQSLPNSTELLVYATHLVGLLPAKSGEVEGDVDVVEGFLMSVGLPVEVVAFAGCILDRLENAQEMETPELMILAALSLAEGYLSDRSRSNARWAVREAAGRFQVKDVGRAKREILEDIDYGLFRISEQDVKSMLSAMQRGLDSPTITTLRDGSGENEEDGRRPKYSHASGTPGQAIWANGVQTPEPSP
ncbi:hypothetical protein CC80DRAFT_493898 [Byssothecium circinans]|uniref:Cyclin N-terminal domain-containing protein n=1 Tax=Byssothecium circinans TaxID=147558 RepID=A0A6A5TPU7_9PLEO|nr:hypothetical protein CC80DRAFT_493898 [Byssothecium circinans]